MAVTIHEMQVDVENRAAPAGAPAIDARPKETVNLRQEMEMTAERELRLKAD